MIEKDIWNFIPKAPQKPILNLTLFSKKGKENQMAIGIIQHIITKHISDQIAINIMDLKDPKKMGDKLKTIYLEIG